MGNTGRGLLTSPLTLISLITFALTCYKRAVFEVAIIGGNMDRVLKAASPLDYLLAFRINFQKRKLPAHQFKLVAKHVTGTSIFFGTFPKEPTPKLTTTTGNSKSTNG